MPFALSAFIPQGCFLNQREDKPMKTRMNLTRISAMAVGGVLVAASHVAVAQGGYQPDAPQQPAQPQQPARPDFNDATLERFAGAWSEVQSIRDEYIGEIQAASDAEQAQSLQQEAQEKMVEAVTDAGVEVSDYNAIATHMGQDPEFAQEIMTMAENR